MDIVTPAIEKYAYDHSRPEPELLQRLSDDTHKNMQWPNMLCGRLEGRLLKLLVQISGAKRVLELGMYTGYSALSMAEGLPGDGTVITCDIDPKARDFAQRYFDQSPHGKKITIKLGPALETIKALPGPFDLVFIDADKVNYLNYYNALIDKVRPGGLFAFDNTLWSGRLLEPKDDSDRTLDALNKAVLADQRVENVLVTIRDGLHLVRKKT